MARWWAFLLGALAAAAAGAQPLLFRHLGAGDGLPALLTRHAADREGVLWMGSAEGLVSFDGLNLRVYTTATTPALRNNNIREIIPDNRNRLWIRTYSSVILLDSNRTFREIVPVYAPPDYSIRNILYTRSQGLLLLGLRHHYRMDSTGQFPAWHLSWDSLLANRIFSDVVSLPGEDQVVFALSNELIWVDYQAEKIRKRIPLADLRYLAVTGPGELVATTNTPGELVQVSLESGRVRKTFRGLRDQSDNPVTGSFFDAEGLPDGRVALTVHGRGLYIFDPLTGKLVLHRHEPGNPGSLADNEKTHITVDRSAGVILLSGKGLDFAAIDNRQPQAAPPFVRYIQPGDSLIPVIRGDTFLFRGSSRDITFHISPGSYWAADRLTDYRFEGWDTAWHRLQEGRLRMTGLKPGMYRFFLRSWGPGNAPQVSSPFLVIVIRGYWWKSAWFRIAVLLGAAALLFLLYKWQARRLLRRSETRLRQQQQISQGLQQQLEMEKVISFFAASISTSTSDVDIAREVTRHCISQLDFEDCVIYFLDPETNELVQVAAWGPKLMEGNEVQNPLRIPVGKGIVGAVAQSGQPEIVADTSADHRYIVDDRSRLSEICVPLQVEGQLIGVIDSEHSEKNFYTQRHLYILTAVATLSANRIVLARAEAARRKAQLDLLELNRKMTEARFMNLRLQMNPHFLFNALSAIQHLIVSQKTNEAYRYLTVFSNLLRAILQYADKNFISLEEEIRILKMYLDIESLRFQEGFSYRLEADPRLDQEEVLLPALLLQPFAENAIWHGLLSKTGEKRLAIDFQAVDEAQLRITITDNGVGRKQASAIRDRQTAAFVYEGKALQIIRDRLDLLERKTGLPASLQITDLFDENGHPAGTRVELLLPFYYNKPT